MTCSRLTPRPAAFPHKNRRSYYTSNYLLVGVASYCYVAVTNPTLLFATAFVTFIWYYAITLSHANLKCSESVSQLHLKACLALLSAVVLVFFVGNALFASLGASSVLILAHALGRDSREAALSCGYVKLTMHAVEGLDSEIVIVPDDCGV